MPSIVTGFEYDIFISYRHNDNRSGWVTEFTKALQEELASTIKEPVSIYFDANPHDGLLETHNVGKSLEGKLKCLIFLPILSQTYCDPKSFAWQYEFIAFNKLAKEDQFGRDIKLAGGNVASRILPIKIHDLDPEDKTEIENEIGGVLRSIEFIFKFSGVNRPLRAIEDHPNDNQNKTFYRDQVNKVANAIKEIITSLKHPASVSSRVTKHHQPATLQSKPRKRFMFFGVVILFLCVASYFFYFKFISSSPPAGVIEKSIAVLPFADLSPTHDQEFLGDGIAEEIINVLAQTEGLKVIARSSSFQFKGKNEDLRVIGEKLGVATILEGSVRRFQDQVRVTAQLINVKDGSHFWSKNYNQKTDNIFIIQDTIAGAVAAALKVTLLMDGFVKKSPHWNEEAQRLYYQGRYFYDQISVEDAGKAYDLFRKSLALDSNQALTHLYLSSSYNNVHAFDPARPDSVEYHLDKALLLDPSLSEGHAIKALRYHWKQEFAKAVSEIAKALSNGHSIPLTLRTAGRLYYTYGQHKKGIEFLERAVELDPLQGRSLYFLARYYMNERRYDEAIRILQKAILLDPADQQYDLYVLTLVLKNDLKEAESILHLISSPSIRLIDSVAIQIKMGNASQTLMQLVDNDQNSLFRVGYLYAQANNPKRAMECLELAFKEKTGTLTEHLSDDPFLDPLRNLPEFRELIRRMNYPKIEQ